MARALSSLKRLRQSKTRAARNKARKSELKTQVGKVLDAVSHKDLKAAQEELLKATKLLDRNANRRTIHPNTAARRKSRLTRKLNALKTTAK